MPIGLFRRIIDQLANKDIVCLSLHKLGELLLHPRIAEMISYAKEKRIKHVRFATNATLLNTELGRKIIDSGLDSITFSMDALSGQRYCPAGDRKNIFTRLDRNISTFIKLRNKKGKKPKIFMQIITMEETKDIIKQFIKKWAGIADDVMVKNVLSWAGEFNFGNCKQINRRLLCMNHLTQGVINWDAKVTTCCLFDNSDGCRDGVIGNIAQNSLDEIFYGKKRLELVTSQLKGDYKNVPHCMRCPDWNDYLDRFRPARGSLQT